MELRVLLACASVFCVLGHIIKHEPDSRLSLNVDDHTQALDGPSHQNIGDLTCMRWSGGTCAIMSCRSERGPTVCEENYCMCAQGTCANAEGVCERGQGKWLGSYTIMFRNPYHRERPYLGVNTGSAAGDQFGWGNAQVGVSVPLGSLSTSQAAWKLALSPGGHVRFESLIVPNYAMKLYNNRRRRTENNHHFLQERAKATNGTSKIGKDAMEKHIVEAKTGIPDDDDIWPMVVPLNSAAPLDVTFRVRPTHRDGGGLEIWDPQTGHALASGNPDWTFRDHVAGSGVAECSDGSIFSSGCEGRQLVEFQPALPAEATPYVARDYITAYGVTTWWQSLLIIILFCSVPVCCFLGCSPSE